MSDNMNSGSDYAEVFGQPQPGRCLECGCTEENACQGGCFWVDDDKTLCSACAIPLDDHGNPDFGGEESSR